jgi:hypothetical protein
MAKIKINLSPSRDRILAFIGLFSLIIVSMVGPLFAQTLTQGYKSDQPLQRGMLVAVDQDDPTKVEALKDESLDRVKGVVVQKNDSPVTLSSDERKIFVASTGEFDVLVSDQNGVIKEGDYISISSLEGIGMKATTAQPVVAGRATEGFKGSGDSISATTVGSGSSYNIGRIKANLEIGGNPLLKSPEKSNVPQFLAAIGENVAAKPVSTVRLYLSAALFVATIGLVGFMLYGGVRSSMIAIGRNPLSKKTITRSLFQVVLVSLLIFITGLFGVYLLLKL